MLMLWIHPALICQGKEESREADWMVVGSSHRRATMPSLTWVGSKVERVEPKVSWESAVKVGRDGEPWCPSGHVLGADWAVLIRDMSGWLKC